MKTLTTYGSLLALTLLPAVTFAQEENLGEIGSFLTTILGFINNILIPVVIGLALLVFIWGMFNYFILGGGDEGKRADGRQLMLYSILAFFMMVAIFAVVNLLTEGFGFDDEEQINDVPNVPVRDVDVDAA